MVTGYIHLFQGIKVLIHDTLKLYEAEKKKKKKRMSNKSSITVIKLCSHKDGLLL